MWNNGRKKVLSFDCSITVTHRHRQYNACTKEALFASHSRSLTCTGYPGEGSEDIKLHRTTWKMQHADNVNIVKKGKPPHQTQTTLSDTNPPHQTQSLQTGPGPSHWAVLSTRPTARSGWLSPSETVTSRMSMQQHTINPCHGIYVHHTNMASSVKWNKCKILKPSPLLH